MSDSAIATICSAIVTIGTSFVGFLVLWVKLKYGVTKVEEVVTNAKGVEGKLDNNTRLTQEGNDATASVANQLNGTMDDRISSIVKSHMSPLVDDIKSIKASVISNTTSIKELTDKMK